MVLCQSVGSEISLLSSIWNERMLLSLSIRNHEKARQRDISVGVLPSRV